MGLVQDILREQLETSLDGHGREPRKMPIGLGKCGLDLVEDLVGKIPNAVLAQHRLAIGQSPFEEQYGGSEDEPESPGAGTHVDVRGGFVEASYNDDRL
jgi:hypothetical protein